MMWLLLRLAIVPGFTGNSEVIGSTWGRCVAQGLITPANPEIQSRSEFRAACLRNAERQKEFSRWHIRFSVSYLTRNIHIAQWAS
jgi:hypothetical protein